MRADQVGKALVQSERQLSNKGTGYIWSTNSLILIELAPSIERFIKTGKKSKGFKPMV